MSRTFQSRSLTVVALISVPLVVAALLLSSPCCIAVDTTEKATPADNIDRSPLQLAVSPDGKRLFTANRTANSVSIIDIAAGNVIAEVPVGGGPNGVAVSPGGETVYVANRLDDTVSVVDVAAARVTQQIAVANQPFDIIVGNDGIAYVSCVGKDEVVQVIDTGNGTVKQTIAVDQNPRHLALSPDGKTLMVTCDVYDTTRYLNAIDLPTGEVRQRIPLAMVSNVRGVAYVRPDLVIVAHLNPNPFAPLTQVQQGWVNTNGITFVFLDGEQPRTVGLLFDEITQYYSNPYDIAVTPDGKSAYVTCGGADQVMVVDIAKAIALINKTPPEQRPQLRHTLSLSGQFVAARIPVGTNPYGIALAPDGETAFVANHLGNSVSVVNGNSHQVQATIDVGHAPETSPLRRGEVLFNTASICFQGQFSCASCHPESHTTGLSWDLEDDGLGSLKNIKSFRGVAGTGPFRWQGEALSIGDEECGPTVTGAMRGQALSEHDLRALEAYVTNVPLLPNPHRGADGKLSAAAERGKLIFEGQASCSRCHSGPALTVAKRRFVDTGEGRYDPLELSDGTTVYPTQFDVPHLLGAWDSDPYLHDGRAKTLHEIFTKHNPDDKHGKTSELTEQELNDLIEYVKSF
ncbi:MAG: beta-propeller fold lactonase family protein [Planctomycetaceae bacterium]|nr:beta-propeller fold lactonase family protein [Planctomycetales bacterium]MCB9937350.1 beta-propeller fold lactonase family protein [Planctomycetaceae bacterium]